MADALQQAADRREIRVFISSTFRDMMQERDLLVKRVFPQLRRKCAQRFVTFTEVDLRWGISEEQSAEGQVLALCLAEIERSRPYFLGLLGERYGWIPDDIPANVVRRQPWLEKHFHGRTSVTELEILHGVLNDPQMDHRAFFYFRDPAYVTNPSLTEAERRDLVERELPSEVAKYGESEAARRTEERKAKLAALKQRIRDSELPVVENYANPEALADIAFRQFDALIDHLYPEAQVPDLLARERLAHKAHARHKLLACIDRPAHLAALNAFAAPAEHDGKGLVVTGDSGGGKTALLAAWSHDWAAAHPDHVVFQHYFGATPESTSPDGFLRRLLGELKERFGIADDIPADSDKLREALPLWLAQTVGRGRIVLVLDGLNQVQGSDPNRRLQFLPRHFPPHVTVLASSLPGVALGGLRERSWTEHHLPLADRAEVDAMVGEYLRIHGRHVDVEGRPLQSGLRRQLVDAPGCTNPLFLRTVLEELRQFGSFEQLPDRVAHYLEADNPRDLFLRVLHRWQEDFDVPHLEQPRRTLGLVHRALTYLWASRQGLSEPEWLELLSDQDEPLPRALWTPLFLALEPHLAQRREGLFAFGHDFLRQAVEGTLLPSGELQQAAHLFLADYFERHPHHQEMTPRKAAEWPYQLHAAEAWDRLGRCLTDVPLFLALYNTRTQWELTGYWHPLRERGLDMGNCYSTAYDRCTASQANASDHFISARIAEFLWNNGIFAAAEPLLKRALANRERALGPEHPETLHLVDELGALLCQKSDYACAKPLLQRALRVRERVLGLEHHDTLMSLRHVAYLLSGMGDDAGAESLYRRRMQALERTQGAEHPDVLVCADDVALSMLLKGDHTGADQLRRWVFAVSERVLGPDHPDTLRYVNNLASTLKAKGDYTGEAPLRRRAMEGLERVLGPDHPDTLTAVNNLAGFFERQGDLALAEPLFCRALEGFERTLGPGAERTFLSMHNLAHLMTAKGDCDDAERLYRRVIEGLLAISATIGAAHPNLEIVIFNYARCLRKQGHDRYWVIGHIQDLCFSQLPGVVFPDIPRIIKQAIPDWRDSLGCIVTLILLCLSLWWLLSRGL